MIAGDFNICGTQEKRNVVSLYLERQGFSQVIEEATHIQGRVIDHVYVNRKDIIIELQRYSPYYSDHDALLISLNIKVKIVTLKINFNLYVKLIHTSSTYTINLYINL